MQDHAPCDSCGNPNCEVHEDEHDHYVARRYVCSCGADYKTYELGEDIIQQLDKFRKDKRNFGSFDAAISAAAALIALSPNCVDCGSDTIIGNEYYMVTDEVWLGSGMKHGHRSGDGYLCIGCLEERIGRALTREDFPDYPVNTSQDTRSARLQARLNINPPR